VGTELRVRHVCVKHLEAANASDAATDTTEATDTRDAAESATDATNTTDATETTDTRDATDGADATDAAESWDVGLQHVHEWVEGLGKAAVAGALLGLLNKRLESGENLLEGGYNSSKAGTVAGLEALHDLAELTEHVVHQGSDGGRSETATAVHAKKGRLKLRGKLAHVACSEGLGHGAAGHHSLHLTQHAKDGLEGLNHLAGLLVGVRAARLALGHAPWGRVYGVLRLGALAG